MKNRFFTIVATLMIAILTLTSCGGNMTVKDYMESAEAKEQIEMLSSVLENDMMSLEFQSEDDAMILVLTMKEDLGMDKETFEAIMAPTMDAQSALFVQMANELKAETNQSSVRIVITYLDHEQEELFSSEFVSDK